MKFKFRSIADSNAAIGKGTQPGTVLWEMLTKLFVLSYFQQNKVLIFLSHFCDIIRSSRV
jgi:hypothetical protein